MGRSAVRPYVGDIKAKIKEVEDSLRVARSLVDAKGDNADPTELIREAAGILAGAVEMIQGRSAALLATQSTVIKLRREKIKRLRAEADALEAQLPKEENNG